MPEAAADRSHNRTGRSVYSLVLPIPIVCFVGAVLTDFAYQGSGGNLLWLNFSSWLIAAGLVFGALATAILILELVLVPLVRHGSGWWQLGALVAAWIVEFVNSLVHARDGWTAVIPLGQILSIIGALLVLLSGWLWRTRAGVRS